MINFLKNYLSTVFFILSIFAFYYLSDFNNSFFIKTISINSYYFFVNSLNVFRWVIIAYIVLLIPFYYFHTWKSKARIILNYLIKKIKKPSLKIKDKEKVSILAWIVKWFFAPLMILWLTNHIFTVINNVNLSYNDLFLLRHSFITFFNKHLFWLAFTVILFLDVFFFTLWYLIESPKLKNKIKSVEPSIFWWLVVLACYPPFNAITSKYIWWYSTDFPQFSNDYMHIILNICLLILMWIYTWASVSLWLKASNLTNRWIISKWPYKYIRHPAYICKNTAWWIWWMPLLIWNLISWQYKHFFIVFFSLLARSTIYYFRAITEERHLSMDGDYVRYKKKVKYKFIPGVF